MEAKNKLLNRTCADLPQPGFEPGTSCLQDKRDNPYAIGAADQSYFDELDVCCEFDTI